MESDRGSHRTGTGRGRLQSLLLVGWEAFGAERGRAYSPLPKWRRKAQRPSCLDWITLLRKEMAGHPDLTRRFACPISDLGHTAAAAA